MIECPDCGKNFRGLKCSCGYHVGSSKVDNVERENRYHEMRQSLDARYFAKKEIWELQAKVRAAVPYRGSLKWAHDILAMENEGLYHDLHGIELAKKALRIRESEVPA